MGSSLNSLATSKKCYVRRREGERHKNECFLPTVGWQQLFGKKEQNTEAVVLWCGVPFQHQEEAI